MCVGGPELMMSKTHSLNSVCERVCVSVYYFWNNFKKAKNIWLRVENNNIGYIINLYPN